MNAKLCVILENVRSAYNVGSVFRTGESAGINHLYLAGYTPYPPHTKLNKTALGSLEHVPWTHTDNVPSLVKTLKTQGMTIWAMETLSHAVSLYQAQDPGDLCMIFGNEVIGISPETLKLADAVVKIPQFGHKESLNIATAVGISLYELIRRRLS